MATFQEMVQQYVNLDYSELLSIAKTSLEKLMPVFNRLSPDNGGAALAVLFLGTALASDGSFTGLEYKMLHDLTGIEDYNTALNMVQAHFSDSKMDVADEIFDACGSDLKTELLTLCLCMVAVDETVTVEESAFLRKLLS